MTAPRTAAEWIAALGLARHPEGGHFRETYRAAGTMAAHGGTRAVSTAIYFLLQRGEISALHRIRSDEVWHFHAGASLELVELTQDRALREHRLGLGDGERPQVVIPAGSWFGARVREGVYTLAGCTVAPGFDFADFELGDRSTLRGLYPRHAALIDAFTTSGERT